MDKSDNKYIVPLTLKLDKHIEWKVYFLKLPSELKEKLTRLEELSRNGESFRGKFIREKHKLPLNSLKKVFTAYLSGITDMKAVGFSSDDSRWLISIKPIDINLVVKIIRIWIDAFYIEESELERKRNNDENAKKFALQLIEEIEVDMFTDCIYSQNLVLFDNEEVVDKDAYSILPLLAVNQLLGSNVFVNGEKSHWMYSGKNEIVTDPILYKDAKDEDYFSYVALFSIQTLPPYNKAYLNINLSSRRWVSKNENGKMPFIQDEKSVYARIDNEKLQVMHAKYNYLTNDAEWVYADKKTYCALYGEDNIVKYRDIIVNPSNYTKGVPQGDYYVTFEYGMKDGKKQMHNQDSGITHMDRCELFQDIEKKLEVFSNGRKIAKKVAGNDTIAKAYFDKKFNLIQKDGLDNEFENIVNSICNEKKIIIEVCYSSGQEDLRNVLETSLKNQLINTLIEVKLINIDGLTDPLVCNEPKKKSNLEGFNYRIKEVSKVMEKNETFTISIVIIHEPKYYMLDGKIDKKVDPKDALRVGFANTGRLTQFITIETFKESEKKRLANIESGKAIKKDGEIDKPNAFNMNVRSTILDVYRQLGIHNFLALSDKKTTLNRKVAVGIHVFNYKNLLNDVSITPFPVVISCDLINHQIHVDTELAIISKFSNKKESVEHISCDYKEFPIIFRKIVEKAKGGKRIQTPERFLLNWFEELDEDIYYEIMIAADGTSRRIIEGITNKDIKEEYNSDLGYVSEIGINGRMGFSLEFNDYKNVDFVRIRVNNEVPDYIPSQDEEKEKFINTSGVYQFEKVFYSQDARPLSEDKIYKNNSTKLNDNSAFTHRNIIEIYPMYIKDKSKELNVVRDIHNLRGTSIQYDAAKTILPMPLHLAHLLEEYFI